MSKRLTFPLFLVIALVLSAAAAVAQTQTQTTETQTAAGGATYVTVSSEFATAAQSLHVTLGLVTPSAAANTGTFGFPVVAGAIDLKTAKGEIIHSGGITLTSASGTRVQLQSFVIDTTSAPVITGLVSANGQLLGRVRLFDLQLPSTVTVPLQPSDQLLNLKGVALTLSSDAATALNRAFSVIAFKGGLNIGEANVWVFLNP